MTNYMDVKDMTTAETDTTVTGVDTPTQTEGDAGQGAVTQASPDLTTADADHISGTSGKVVNAIQGAEGKREISPEQKEKLLVTLKRRFEANMKRHEGMEWEKVLTRLEARPEKLWSLRQMEINGHEPDVVDYIETTGEYVFLTTSGLNNAGHTSLVYDKETEDCVKERQAYDETSIIEMVKRDRTGWPVEAIERAIEENGAFQKSSCYVKRNVVDLAAEMGVEIPEPALFCKIVEKRDLDPRDTWVKILVDNKWVGAKMAAARSNFKDGKFTGRIEANYVVGKFGGALKAQSFRGVLKV